MSGMNLLHAAILLQDQHSARHLAKELASSGRIDINERDRRGNTAIHYATIQDYPDVVDMLVERGADVNIVNLTGVNALYLCAKNGSAATAILLLRGGASVDTVVHSERVLHVAAGKGNFGVVEVLLLAGAMVNPLRSGSSDPADFLYDGATPIFLASLNGHADVVEVLVESGARVDQLTLRGESPIFVASLNGHADVVRVLLRAKANWKLAFRGWTALAAAVRLDRNVVVREFQQQVGFEGSLAGPTFMIDAIDHQNLELLSILVDGGVVDLAGGALCRAVLSGSEGSVEILLHHAREVGDVSVYVNSAHDEKGFSVLECCFVLTCLKPRILRRLVDKGLFTDVSLKPRNNDTPNDETKVRVEAMKHLIKRVPAIRAFSWGWPVDVQEPKKNNAKFTTTSSFVITNVRPKSRVLLAVLLRKKNDELFVG